MADVGFVGLGTMGAAMVRRLLDRGHRVTVWNRSPERADELVDRGAVRAATVAETLASGLVHSMLADDAAVLGTFTDALLSAAPPGLVHVNHATVGLQAADALTGRHREAGVGYVAAPVLGRAPLAEAGTVNVVAAGAPDVLDRVRPLLDDLARRTFVVGDAPRQASLVKIAVNYNLIHALQAIAESATLVEHGGVDSGVLVEVLTEAAFTGSAYGGYGPMIASRRYRPPGFTVALGAKDLALAEAAADDLGVVLPTSPVLRDLFARAVADPDLDHLDWSAVAEVTRGLAR